MILNRLALKEARLTNVAKSWLSATLTSSNDASTTPAPEPELPEIEFTPDVDNAGLGAVVTSADGDGSGRQVSVATEKLRKQMLGRQAGRQRTAGKEGPAPGFMGSKPQPQSSRTQVSDDNDEEEGRSGLASRKGKHTSKASKAVSHKALLEPGKQGEPQETVTDENAAAAKASKKRPQNYLDEILAERANKKKKKNKKKNTVASENS